MEAYQKPGLTTIPRLPYTGPTSPLFLQTINHHTAYQITLRWQQLN